MAQERTAVRVPPAIQRRPAVSNGVQRSAAESPRSPAQALQQRLGSRGAQLFAAQVVARSSAPSRPLGGVTSAGALSLSHPGDAQEREADRVADVVMRTTVRGSTPISPSTPTVQRACADCKEETSTRGPDQPEVAGGEQHVHRSASSAEASQVSAPVAANIHNMQGGGAPLSASTRALFEPRFGADFSHVRVHTGTRADSTAKAISAKAFTVGSNIVFAGGQYSPESREGQRLLAHELTHVVQQGAGARPLNRQADRVDLGIVTATHAPTIHRSWYNFDIPFTDYQFDPSLEGIKTAASVVKDAAVEGLKWIVDEITSVVNSGIQWISEQWEGIKNFASSTFNSARNSFTNIISFIKNPLGFLADAFISLDAQVIARAWARFSGLVSTVANGFKVVTDKLLNGVNGIWRGINGFATSLLDRVAGLTNNFLFKKLPDALQQVAIGFVNRLKSFWKKINDGWNTLFKQIKTWVDGALNTVFSFVRRVLSFGINVVIAGIIAFGKIVLFLKDLFSNPMKYVAIMAQRAVQAFEGTASRFAGLVGQYFGSAKTAAPAATAAIKVHRTPEAATPAETKRSASWGEIGDGIAEMMGKKWREFKSNPLSVITGLLLDMVLPIVGDIKDIIQLFKDIKKIVTGPLSAGSLEELWTSLLQILDIPILIYHTVVSILMRSLMLPLIVATFIPHPLVKGIAAAVGYALLGAFVQAEGLNLAQKLLLLKTGVTTKAQKEEAYNRVADSLIALAMTAVIIVIMLILHFIANVMKGVYNFVKGKVFGIETAPVEGKGTGPGEGKGKAGDADADPNKSKPLEKADLGFENGKRVLAEEPTADGKHKIKVTEGGECLYCTTCGNLIKEYAIELTEPKNAGVLAELDTAEQILNPKIKASRMAQIEEKLAEIRKKNPLPNDPVLARQARIDLLARDPAHGGKVTPASVREAEVAVSLEEKGEIRGPIQRDATGAADFIDADGKPWDVKGFNSNQPVAQGGFDLATDVGKVDISLAQGENVMVDTGQMTPNDVNVLKAEGAKPPHNWGGRVKFFP